MDRIVLAVYMDNVLPRVKQTSLEGCVYTTPFGDRIYFKYDIAALRMPSTKLLRKLKKEWRHCSLDFWDHRRPWYEYFTRAKMWCSYSWLNLVQFFGLPMGLNKLKTEMNKKPLSTKGIQHETHVYHFPQCTRHLVRGWVESCRTSCICYRIAASEVSDTKEPEKTKIILLSSFLRRR